MSFRPWGALRQEKASGCVPAEEGAGPASDIPEPGKRVSGGGREKIGPCQCACGNGSFHLSIISALAAGEFREEYLQSTAFPGSCALLTGESLWGFRREGRCAAGQLRAGN